jgi:UDP-glucose 4-epimerase
MTEKRIITITGVSGWWGSQLAKKLISNPEFHIIGIDMDRPEPEIDGLDYIEADIRNPLLAELLKSEKVDTVCHLAFSEQAKPNEAAFDLNVMGTVKLFGACVAAGVRKIVYKSSTMVYGALPTNPGFILEDSPLRGTRRYGYVRDQIETELFCNGFRRQHPHILLSILRFPNIIGSNTDSPITKFIKDPFAPALLGFDPMLQFIHEKDVVAALTHAVVHDYPGIFNVANEGIVPLSKMSTLVGKTPIFIVHLLAYWGLGAFGSAVQSHMPFDPDYIRYRWVTDIQRMKSDFKFTPEYTAEEALREYASTLRTRHFRPDSKALDFDTDRLRDTLERRRRVREGNENYQEMEG